MLQMAAIQKSLGPWGVGPGFLFCEMLCRQLFMLGLGLTGKIALCCQDLSTNVIAWPQPAISCEAICAASDRKISRAW